MRDETKCIRCGYTPKNLGPRMVPVVQSTTYVFDSTQEVGDVFDGPAKALIHSRFANPTVMAIRQRIADLEGGIGAACIFSGQATTLLATLNPCKVGDNLINTSQIYGKTVNLSAVTLKNYGIECIFVDVDTDGETISIVVRENARLIFGEMIANLVLSALDIEELARIAYSHKIPPIMDGTFATPILYKPFEFGADIVVRPTPKYMDDHAIQVGDVIVDSGNFDWTNGKFPESTEPNESYHGATYVGNYDGAAYITKTRMQLTRGYSTYPAVSPVFLLSFDLETLAARMERYCKNALEIANYLAASDKIEEVIYPGPESGKYYPLAEKYLRGMNSVISFIVKDDKGNAVKSMDGLKFASIKVHATDIHTCVLHPISATHRQLTEGQLYAVGINPDIIRFSVGPESTEDITEDVERSLGKV